MLAATHNGRRLDLENPLFVRLINCATIQDRVKFADLFGDLPEPADAFQDDLKRTAALLLEPSLGSEAIKAAFQVEAANSFLLGDVSIKPRLAMREDGSKRVVLEVPNLAEFMMLELAAAVEAEDLTKRCANCDKLFLYGPLTGRRSSATYCADKCRVAAMRARNSSKGSKE